MPKSLTNAKFWLNTCLVATSCLIATELKTVAQPLELKTRSLNSNSLSHSARDLNLSPLTEPTLIPQTSSVKPAIGFDGRSLRFDELMSWGKWRFQSPFSFDSSIIVPQVEIATESQPLPIAQAPEEPIEELEQLPASDKDETTNTGQDPTKPITRFDLRLKYQNISDLDLPGFDDDLRNWILTLRADSPIPVGESGWVVGSRVDLPLIINNIPSADNIDGGDEFGLSDSLIQLLAIAPAKNQKTFAVGTQVIFPTATQDQFGTGKWQLAPTLAGKVDLPAITPGSFVALLLRDQFSFAGDSDRDDIHQLVIQPVFNVNLPQAWFVTLAPEIRLDWDEGDWFVPFDVTLGKLINPSTVASLEVKTPLIDDLDSFQFEIEGRLGFFF